MWSKIDFLTTPFSPDAGGFTDWCIRWLDINDAKKPGADRLTGIIHTVSRPEPQGNNTWFAVDFGSASILAFEELLTVLTALGVKSITVSSPPHDPAAGPFPNPNALDNRRRIQTILSAGKSGAQPANPAQTSGQATANCFTAPNALDQIRHSSQKNEVVLIISETRPPNDGEQWKQEVAAKANAYLAYIRTRLFVDYAHLSGATPLIRLDCLDAPRVNLIPFLVQLKSLLRKKGIRFVVLDHKYTAVIDLKE